MFLSSPLLAAFLLITPRYTAQQPPQTEPVAPPPLYDVVSIHQNKAGSNGGSIRNGDASFIATNVSATTLVANAYSIRPALISGLPGWANSVRFDVNAKISDPDISVMTNLSRDQRRVMLIALLADLFHLKAHIETKTLPVYDLVIAKGGPKLKENTALPDPTAPGTGPHNMKPGSMMMSNSELTAVGVPISNLASNLDYRVGRNIINKTGLTSKYDFTLKFAPTPPGPDAHDNGASSNDAPDLFTALQEQLGLKLEPSKGPVDTLVIDHIEMPSAN